MRTILLADTAGLASTLFKKMSCSQGEVTKVSPPVGSAGPIDVRKTPKKDGFWGRGATSPQEFALLKKLEHPRIVKVNPDNDLAPREAGDSIYMQYGGVPLSALEHGTLGPALLQRVMQQGLEALLYLKEKNIIHKDIKPDNMLIDPAGDIKVIDFGLAEELGNRASTGQPDGHIMYTAPEMGRGFPDFDVSVDMFSLGCTMYQVLTGTTYKDTRPGSRYPYIDFNKRYTLKEHIKKHAPDLPDEFVADIVPLLQSMLNPIPGPDARITPEEALKHPFFKQHYAQEKK